MFSVSRSLLKGRPAGDVPGRERPVPSSPGSGDALEEVADRPEREPSIPFEQGEPGPIKVGGTAVNGFPSYIKLPGAFMADSSRVGVPVKDALNEL